MLQTVSLSTLDWIVLIGLLSIIVAIGISFTSKAGGNITNFFLGGRNLPWYIAGVSMVATTFAADTPLAVTELVFNHGISGNWLWWNMLAGGLLTTFFFAHLWRRAGVLTEVELIELRYAGAPAAFLRGLKAVYLGAFMNCIIIGFVNLALITLLEGFFNLGTISFLSFQIPLTYVITALLMLLVAIYAALSGLLGVAITDFLQFILAMTGSIVLAIIVINSEEIGGISNLKSNLPDWSLQFFPTISNVTDGSALAIGAGSFFAMVVVQWWASWYPGSEPGGGGYVAQRMMSAKTEKDAVYASLLFQMAHYCLRPWPWVIVALCCIVLYPELADNNPRMGYVLAMKDFLPSGLKGLMLAAFFAAYMSTISTQLNWGASNLVNDFYHRFVNKTASDKQLVKASRIATLLLMLLGLFATTQMNSISGAWSFIIECGAGLGLVLIVRWLWWRINVWSEISATLIPFVAYGLAKLVFVKFDPAWGKGLLEDPRTFFFTVSTTTVGWVVITMFTKPEPTAHLQKFYDRVRPSGLWKPFENDENKQNLLYTTISWLSTIIMTYSILFATGKLIFMEWQGFTIWLGLAIFGFVILRLCLKKSNLFLGE